MSGRFHPDRYARDLLAIIDELAALQRFDARQLQRILRRHPKDGRGLFAKSEIVRGFRHFGGRNRWDVSEESFLERLRMKPVRTASGIAPVTVLTKPFPCPGHCIFCPSDVRMPKSYLSDEPGAQRAAQHRFDPYAQSLSRLLAYHNNGHRTDKIELIILGGTWSHYPEPYQIWFVKRCFDALNDLSLFMNGREPVYPASHLDFTTLNSRVDGRGNGPTYNTIVADFARSHPPQAAEEAEWQDLAQVQVRNETADARCVGLVVETRPDRVSQDEVVRMRRLGATKVQIGFQSLSDQILRLNRRGHDVAAMRRAVRLLRAAGFKIHAHWMPNLYGSTPELDLADFDRLFADPDFRPDELKIYPCSLIESAELMRHYESGSWRPYERSELMAVLTECLRRTPAYCRITRVIRDIPGTEIVAGNRITNLRELVEAELDLRSCTRREIRSREVRDRMVAVDDLRLQEIAYSTSVGSERFLQFVDHDGRLAAFLRLSLPSAPVPVREIRRSAMIREVHVYGNLVGLGRHGNGRAQHLGLGRRLVARAEALAAEAGFRDLAVISSVGTRGYYRRLGFEDEPLYQKKRLRCFNPRTPRRSSTGHRVEPARGSW